MPKLRKRVRKFLRRKRRELRRKYWYWKLTHPLGRFEDFYVARIATKLGSGKAHRTLGTAVFDYADRNRPGPAHDFESFANTGRFVFEDVSELGLASDDVVIDYGCGALRVGQHFIRYLNPGGYTGMDVTDRFYREGRDLIPPETLSEKRPSFHVINETTLKDCAAKHPDFVISVSVLKHVPPRHLDRYLSALTSLMSPRTRLVIYFTASDTQSRIANKSWAYEREDIIERVRHYCPGWSVRATQKAYQTPLADVGPEFWMLVVEPS